tara:strand:+ start:11405 stop:11908 length:504 start_codon:yes stop_codon:yes gene_type:complete
MLTRRTNTFNQSIFRFTAAEIYTIKKTNSKIEDYILYIIIKTLSLSVRAGSVYINSYYGVDMCPLYDNITIEAIRRYINWSRKGVYGKKAYLKYRQARSECQPPIIINLNYIPATSILKLDKTHCMSEEAILININFNEASLIVNFGYDNSYAHITETFTFIVNNIF